ncbi:MAG: DNA polymerase III subunit delta [Anaerolineae bacterium]
MIYLLHGPDELLRSERLATIRAGLGAPELAELSTSWLDGRKTSVTEVCYHCDVMPFLTPRRLVIVNGLLAQLKRRQAGGKKKDLAPEGDTSTRADAERDALLAYLPTMPDTTDLVLLEAEPVARNERPYKALTQLAGEGRAEIVLCDAPEERDLPDWVLRRAKQKGGVIEREAAFDLATSIGRNLRLLDNELEKLLAYRGNAGTIRREDVRLLVPYTQEASIFDMVDALGQQDGPRAVRLLRELERDGAAPLYLLSMIVRQFRILVQVSDQMSLGLGKDEIAKAIGLHPFPTQKAMQQCRAWRMSDLAAAYDRLLAADLAIKTGKQPDDLAIELLVVELSQRA